MYNTNFRSFDMKNTYRMHGYILVVLGQHEFILIGWLGNGLGEFVRWSLRSQFSECCIQTRCNSVKCGEVRCIKGSHVYCIHSLYH